MTSEMPTNTDSQREESRNEQIAEAVQKTRHAKQSQTDAMPTRCMPGEVSRIMAQMLAVAHWPEIDTDNAQQVTERIQQYHCFCAEHDLKPSVVGMALAIGTDRITMWKWEHGIESSKPQDVRNAIRKGREINEMMMIHLLQNGRVSPAAAIFLLKNDHGYKDQQDVVITPTSPYDSVSQEELAQRYLDGTVQPDVSIE